MATDDELRRKIAQSKKVEQHHTPGSLRDRANKGARLGYERKLARRNQREGKYDQLIGWVGIVGVIMFLFWACSGA